jgi:hypothetical protein
MELKTFACAETENAHWILAIKFMGEDGVILSDKPQKDYTV